jgi:hypothetical protein
MEKRRRKKKTRKNKNKVGRQKGIGKRRDKK